MAMSYTELVASKATAGSIANWFNYTRLDLPTVLDEAQRLIFTYLRVREMRSSWTFGLAEGRSRIALPSDFLDPNGQLLCVSHYIKPDLKPASFVEEARNYEEVASVSLGTDPFTSVINTPYVTVTKTAHDLTEGSVVTFSDVDAIATLDLNGGFPVTSLPNANAFVVDAQSNANATASAGGGALGTFTASKLLKGYPDYWAIGDGNCAIFDTAMNEAMRFRAPVYRMPALLSTSNETNFLTTRYPHLLRVACLARAAKMQKDSDEEAKHVKEMLVLIGDIQRQDDLSYYGATISTDNP